MRPLEAENEFEEYWRLHVEAFGPPSPEAHEAERRARRASAERRPGFDPSHLRGAFRDGHLLGGYEIEPRVLCIGAARVTTGCIGGVVTHPDHRRQGVARALMADALACARVWPLGLLLLDGIPNLYHRFGYADVHDHVTHEIDLKSALAVPPGARQTRRATVDDAQALLDLYHRAHAAYVGRFERSLERQSYHLASADPEAQPIVSVADGRVDGYAVVHSRRPDLRVEVAAENDDALVALLHQHANACQTLSEPPTALRWRFPPGSWLHFALAERVTLSTRAHSVLKGDWMARPGDVATLDKELRPLWTERATFPVDIAEDGEQVVLRLDERALSLDGGTLAQLLFGFRPAWWLFRDRAEAPVEILNSVFPVGVAYIAGTDQF